MLNLLHPMQFKRVHSIRYFSYFVSIILLSLHQSQLTVKHRKSIKIKCFEPFNYLFGNKVQACLKMSLTFSLALSFFMCSWRKAMVMGLLLPSWLLFGRKSMFFIHIRLSSASRKRKNGAIQDCRAIVHKIYYLQPVYNSRKTTSTCYPVCMKMFLTHFASA